MLDYFSYPGLKFNTEKISDLVKNKSREFKHSSFDANEIEFIKEYLNIGLSISYILYLRLVPKVKEGVHKDHDVRTPDDKVDFALNLPLYNCSETYMRWYYELKNSEPTYYQSPQYSGTRLPILPGKFAIERRKATIDRPCFVNVQTWHSIENQNDTESAIMSIRFDKSLTYEEVLASLSSTHK